MNEISTALTRNIPFCAHIGMQPAAAGVALPDAPELRNHVGTMHAGALYTLGETASGAAVMAELPELFGGLVVVKTASVTYRKPAKGAITAIGKLVEPTDAVRARLEAEGKAVFDVAVSLTDPTGLEVATMNVSWYAKR